jgi:hypothetical protein
MISLKIAPKSGRLYGKLPGGGKPNAGAAFHNFRKAAVKPP